MNVCTHSFASSTSTSFGMPDAQLTVARPAIHHCGDLQSEEVLSYSCKQVRTRSVFSNKGGTYSATREAPAFAALQRVSLLEKHIMMTDTYAILRHIVDLERGC